MATVKDGQWLYAVVVIDVNVDGCADRETGTASIDHSSKFRIEMVLESEDAAEDTARCIYGHPYSVTTGTQAYVLPVMFCETHKEVADA